MTVLGIQPETVVFPRYLSTLSRFQSNKFGDGGDCGIYVGSIMKGGAVALDGRIEPGDMILQVNDRSFENMSNDEAVSVVENTNSDNTDNTDKLQHAQP